MNENNYLKYGNEINLEYGYSGMTVLKLISMFSMLSERYRFIDSLDIGSSISKDIDMFLVYNFYRR